MEKINKVIKLIKENKWIHYAIITIIGIILAIPLCKICIRDTHDGSLHFLRMFGTVNSLKIGEFPPMVAPFFCNGGGYSMNIFYNPIVTYVPLLFKLFTPTYMLALKLFAGLTIILSGITMYQFMYNVTKKRTIAIFSAIIYMVAPYKLGCIYRRFAIGEFTAFIFIPILFSGLYNLFNQDGKKHYLIALGAIGLLLSHTITTFYMAIIAFVYILINIKKLKEKDIWIKLGINIVFIVLICLFFILPLFEAKVSSDYTIFDNDIMCTNGDYVYSKALDIGNLFFDGVGKYEDAIFSIGVPIFTLLCLSVFVYKKISEEYKQLYLTSIFFCIISLFMCTKFFPWYMLPDFLCKLQYSWRMLTFFNFFSSIIIGINIYLLLKMFSKKDILRLLIFVIFIITVIVYTIPILLQFKTKNENLDEEYETQITSNPYIDHFMINRDYMPKNALFKQNDYLNERDYNKIYILDGSAIIENEEKINLSFTFDLKDAKEKTVLEFPFFFFPGYKITIEENGEKIETDAVESENGFVCYILNKDIQNAKVTAQYKGTTITNISYGVSFVALIAFIIYIIWYRKKIKS